MKKKIIPLIILVSLLLNAVLVGAVLISEYAEGSDDDVMRFDNGAYFDDTQILWLQHYQQGIKTGIRIRNVTVPRYAVIQSANLSVYIFEERSPDPAASMTVYGVDTSNVSAFDSATFGSLPYTDNSHTIDISAANSTGWFNFTVTDCVQEIVNRYGWGSGQNIGFIIQSATGSIGRSFASYDYNSNYAERLYINYTTTDVKPNLEFVENYKGFNIFRNQTGLNNITENTIMSSVAVTETYLCRSATYPYEELGFYDDDNDVFLLFFWVSVAEASPDNLVYTTSSDFLTWSTRIDAGFNLDGIDSIDVTEHRDGSYDFDIVNPDADDLEWRRGYLNTSDNVVYRGSHNIDYVSTTNRVFGGVDLDGYSYAGIRSDNPTITQYYMQNDRDDGTFNVGWSASYVSNVYTENDGFGLENHEFILLSSRIDQYLRSLFNDQVSGWGSYQYMTDQEKNTRMYDAALLSNFDVFVIAHDYDTANLVHFNIWDYSAEDWITYDNFTLTGLGSDDEVHLSIDQTDDIVYVTWFDDTNDRLKLIYSDDLGLSWSSEITAANVSNIWDYNNVPQLWTPPYVENNYLPIFFCEDDGGTYRLQVVSGSLGIGEEHYYVYDDSDDLVAYCFTDENTTRKWIDDNYPPDPEDPGSDWDDQPFNQIQFRLYWLVFALGMLMFPMIYGFKAKPSASTWVILILVSMMGYAFLLQVRYI